MMVVVPFRRLHRLNGKDFVDELRSLHDMIRVKQTISVVMPSYNAGAYIAQAIESVFAQTLADWELIIVDDGSTDDTSERVLKYLGDPRVAYVRKTNGGQASARNLGIRMAKSDVIALLDADDFWHPTKLEKQIAVFENYPEVGVCGTALTIVSADGLSINNVRTEGFHGKPFPSILFGTLADMTTALIRRDVFDRVGFFDEKLIIAPDSEFWLRAGRFFHFHTIPEPLAFYRTGHANISGSRSVERRKQFLKVVLPRFLKEQGGYEYVKPWHVWKVKSICYLHQADSSESKLSRVWWNFRSIAAFPLHWDAYASLSAVVLPAYVHCWVKAVKTTIFSGIRRSSSVIDSSEKKV